MRPRFLSAGSPQRIRVVGGSSRSQRHRAAKSRARLDGKRLIEVDLTALVSKYVGETERNIRRLIETAERTNAVLYLDEADALFDRQRDAASTLDRRVPTIKRSLASVARRHGVVLMNGRPSRPARKTGAAAPKPASED